MEQRDFVLTATATTQPIELSPNAQVTLTFILTDGGHPVPGQTVSFTTIGSSTTGAEGATVAEPSGVTGADGSVSVVARAGLADFRVEAQIGTAKADVTVDRRDGTHGDGPGRAVPRAVEQPAAAGRDDRSSSSTPPPAPRSISTRRPRPCAEARSP